MPTLPYPKYGLQSLYLFTRYGGREEYQRAVGQEPPPWNPHRPPKYWFDPAASSSQRRNVVYDLALVTSSSGSAIAGPDGKPMLDVLVLKKEEAATVNIPPDGPTEGPAWEPEVQVPLRPLEPGEELFFDFGGGVAVKNVALFAALEVGFKNEDRILLKAIARKLGIEP